MGLTIPGNWSFVADFVKSSRFHVKIMRHSLPTALHESEEFFLNYLILRFSGGFLADFMCNQAGFVDFNKMSFWVITKFRSFLMKDQLCIQINLINTKYSIHICYWMPANDKLIKSNVLSHIMLIIS